MPNRTQEACLIAALQSRGFTLAKDKYSSRYTVLKPAPGATISGYFYVGKKGALRYGRIVTESRALNETFRRKLLEEGKEILK